MIAKTVAAAVCAGVLIVVAGTAAVAQDQNPDEPLSGRVPTEAVAHRDVVRANLESRAALVDAFGRRPVVAQMIVQRIYGIAQARGAIDLAAPPNVLPTAGWWLDCTDLGLDPGQCFSYFFTSLRNPDYACVLTPTIGTQFNVWCYRTDGAPIGPPPGDGPWLPF